MMKRSIPCLIFLVFVSGCTRTEQHMLVPVPLAKEANPLTISEHVYDPFQKLPFQRLHDQAALKHPVLEHGYEGRVDEIPVGIGDSLQSLPTQMGSSIQSAMIGKDLVVQYKNAIIHTNASITVNNDITDGEVTGLEFTRGNELYGVSIGMSFEEIEDVLGPADRIEKSRPGASFGMFSKRWMMVYDLNRYVLVFYSNTRETGTSSAILSGKQSSSF